MIALVVLLLVLGGCAYAVYTWLTGSSQGTVQQAPTSTRQYGPQFKTYDGRFFSFDYRSGYNLQKKPSDNPAVEVALLRASTTYEKLLAVATQPNTNGDMTTDTGYYFRQSQPAIYRKQDVIVDGSKATEWIKNDGSEISVYIPRADRYAVLAFTIAQSNDTEGLPAEANALLQTFRWK